MSKEAATAFIEKARSDSELQQKLTELGPDANAGDLMDVAAAHGYTFSEEDLAQAARAEIEAQANKGELSEADLEAVAGGMGTTIISLVSRTVTTSIMK